MNNTQELSDEITLKDLIIKVQSFIYEVLKNWLLVGIICVFFVGLLILKRVLSATEYTAPVSFTLTEESGGVGGIASVAAQFGFAGMGGSTFNQEKIVHLISTKKILQNALFNEVTIDGEKDYIANAFIRIYELEEKFEDNENMVGYTKFKNKELSTKQDKIAFKMIYKRISEKMLTKSFDLLTGIMSYTFVSKSEDLSYELTNAIFRELDEFYTKKAVEPQQRTFNILQERADSIWGAMRQAEYRSAKLEDTDKGFFFATESVLHKQRATRDIQMLAVMYQEVAKNLEFARFSLENSTPILQEIDMPMYPLEDNKGSIIKTIIIGLFIGGFFGVAFVVARKIYRDVMEGDDD